VPNFYTRLTAHWFTKIIRFACWMCVIAVMYSLLLMKWKVNSERYWLTPTRLLSIIKVELTQNFTPGLNNLRAINQRGWRTNTVHAISLWAKI